MDTTTTTTEFVDDHKNKELVKSKDFDDVIQFVNGCIDKLQVLTGFEIYDRETNKHDNMLFMRCIMEGDEYSCLHTNIQFHNNTYYASLTYINGDNSETIDDMISVEKKSMLISKIQSFVDNVEQKLNK